MDIFLPQNPSNSNFHSWIHKNLGYSIYGMDSLSKWFHCVYCLRWWLIWLITTVFLNNYLKIYEFVHFPKLDLEAWIWVFVSILYLNYEYDGLLTWIRLLYMFHEVIPKILINHDLHLLKGKTYENWLCKRCVCTIGLLWEWSNQIII